VKQQEREKLEAARRAPITVTINATAPMEAPAPPSK
jgi:hypothetical protein